jgi:glycine/D-amino acid oxidase-like deaminating enzyme
MRVAVLGGGLQGACVALELAVHGIQVDLFERDDRCFGRASAHNEGKIHLGYVYAKDPTRQTARLMARGAVCFQTLMRRWIGDAIDRVPVSDPFFYAVHRESLLTIEQVEEHFGDTQRILLEESNGHGIEYFGSDYREAPARLSDDECARHFDPRAVQAAYRTAEIAIDSEALGSAVRERLSDERRICSHLQSEVCAVTPTEGSVAVAYETRGHRFARQYDHVVNTLWDGRLAIDLTAGVPAPRPWLLRTKHFLRMRAPRNGSSLPTTTILLGPFGDIVSYTNDETFLSWYPAGMTEISSALESARRSPELKGEAAGQMRENILAGLAGIIPAAGRIPAESIDSCRVKAGVIFAWGTTDITDLASGLHERFAVGPVSHGRYHTVDTGKLTLAPYFGKMVADRILGRASDEE